MSLNEVKQFTVTHLHASVLDFPELQHCYIDLKLSATGLKSARMANLYL